VLKGFGLKLKNRVGLSVLIQPPDEPAFGLEERELDAVLAFIVEHFSGLGNLMNVHNSKIRNRLRIKKKIPGSANQSLKFHGVNWGDHSMEFS
jgi:hypothetical protein